METSDITCAGGVNLDSENHDEVNLYAITFKSRKGKIIRYGDHTARANGTTAYDTRRDKISVAIDEEATIADYELTLKCCGGKRFIKSGHNKFFVRKSKYRPYPLVLRLMKPPKESGVAITCLQCKKTGPCSSILKIK